METKSKVPADLAHDMIKNIRILALNGKTPFRKYLYDPLFEAGWSNDDNRQDIHKLIERLKEESSNPSLFDTIAPRCKRVICYSMKEKLSVLGNSSIFFLEKIQANARVAASPESVEFAGIIAPPLNEFNGLNSEKNEKLFLEAVNTAEVAEILTALEPVKLGSSPEKVKLDDEIKRLYDNIQIASSYHNIPKCRRLLSSYIIHYSDKEDYSRSDVEKLIEALAKREPGFESDLKNTIAIDLYYRITQSVHGGDIKTTIQGIRKYGYIFEGDSASKHFYDIDRLERILYKIISEKNLWKELKKDYRGIS